MLLSLVSEMCKVVQNLFQGQSSDKRPYKYNRFNEKMSANLGSSHKISWLCACALIISPKKYWKYVSPTTLPPHKKGPDQASTSLDKIVSPQKTLREGYHATKYK